MSIFVLWTVMTFANWHQFHHFPPIQRIGPTVPRTRQVAYRPRFQAGSALWRA